MRFESQSLVGDIVVDGNQFVNCVFQDARLIHTGGPFELVGCSSKGIVPAVGGAALNTLQFLRMIRSMDPACLESLISGGKAAPKPDKVKRPSRRRTKRKK